MLERAYLEDDTNGGSSPISSIYSYVIFGQFYLVLWACFLICKMDRVSSLWPFSEDEIK